jgi:putative transposase
MSKETNRCRTYRYRLHPTFRQTQALLLQLEYQRELYNAALEERINAWRYAKRSVTYVDQCRTLTGLKEVRPEVLTSGVRLCRGTLMRLDRAFSAFHRRVKKGEVPGYPRFKSEKQFDSLQWEDPNGWKVKMEVRRLYLPGIGEIKANYHRPLLGVPKAITVKREGKKWWVSVRCVGVPSHPLVPNGREVGLDLGIKNLVATSDGELLAPDRFGAKSQKRIAIAQRQAARCHEGSNRRKRKDLHVAQLHRKVANQRRNAAHQLSRRLVNDFDFIAIEDLEISKMVRANKAEPKPMNQEEFFQKRRARRYLSKSIYDAGWGTLLSLLLYKAESAGRVVVKVRPHYTSQMCAECDHINPGNRVNQAAFRCLACGHLDHADINAARNILRAGRARQALACAGR